MSALYQNMSFVRARRRTWLADFHQPAQPFSALFHLLNYFMSSPTKELSLCLAAIGRSRFESAARLLLSFPTTTTPTMPSAKWGPHL
jgi:hypothetical protein